MEVFNPTGEWMLALGKTIIHSFWIALLLLSFLKMALTLIPSQHSSLRYRISMLTMLLLLGSVAATFFILYSPVNSVTNYADLTGEGIFMPGRIKGYVRGTEFSRTHMIYLLSSYIYFAGMPIVLLRSLASFHYQHVMKKSGSLVQGTWQERFTQLKKGLGIKRSIALMESDAISIPALVGFFKPVILLPIGMFSNLSASQVETLLMHELYHLRRGDAMANMLQLIIENIFFYNPAVWTISNLIRNERENCCDDGVLNACGDPLVYARALYQMAGPSKHFSPLAPGAGGSDKHQLYKRIKRILNIDTMKNNLREKLFSFLFLFGGVIVLFTITGFTSGFSIVKNHESRQKEILSQSTPTPAQAALLVDTIPEVVPQESLVDPSEKEVDRDEIKKEMEEAKIKARKALEEIDWEQMKQEMEKAKIEARKALEEIDWEEMKQEMEKARIEARKALEEIDWEEMKQEMEKARIEARKALEEIDWDKIKKEMEDAKFNIDSLFDEMQLNFEELDLDRDFDFDVDSDGIALDWFSDFDFEFPNEGFVFNIDAEDFLVELDSFQFEMDFLKEFGN